MPYLRPFTSVFFLLPLLLFLLNQVLIYFQNAPTWMSSYLDDLLVLPIILPLPLSLLKMMQKKPGFRLDGGMVITAFLLLVLVFEVVLPRFSSSYTADVMDVFYYAVGGAYFWFFQNK